MEKRLEGTVALVTGASSGIGEATARRLAAEGANVVVVARRRERLEKLVATLAGGGRRALAIEADITEPAQARGAIQRAVAEFGRLDVLVNNAGLALVGAVAEAPEEEWERMLAVNVRAVLTMTRAALPHLVRAAEDSSRRVADLVNISSTAGRVARPSTAVYSLTKFGVNAFSESLRQEMQSKRVRVSLVEPGIVQTELDTHLRADVRETIAKQTGGVEKLLPEDVADAVAYVVTRDRRVAVNEMLVRAGAQTW
ncbi:clavaldehyde dehydrogenase [Labilithrix luteola]|uniref:Clavaldehyde dehydrogenase n=1 Tax=Labilithrix luteola TaxID=1391654 RepID=A0A0K1PQB8_9BACT|nr:SDR family NAD(P)-dependent oxidoreductase [Labilithrix luteola]AKU95712.1 clavaldehyde dehydrogenase [Labilithrix luteola]